MQCGHRQKKQFHVNCALRKKVAVNGAYIFTQEAEVKKDSRRQTKGFQGF